MKNLKACYYELKGTNYEVGKLLGEKIKAVPQFLEMQKMPKSPFSKEEQIQIIKMFDFNSSVYYSSPQYLKYSYLEGKLLA